MVETRQVYEALRCRRSIRRFKPDPIPPELVQRLVQSALLSPSSRNIRPWHFIVVDNKKLLTDLSSAKPHGASFLNGAALGIVVAADTTQSDVWVEDTSIASASLLLMAEALGLGACWVQIRQRPHDDTKTADVYVKERLGLPNHFAVESIIALGYPDESHPPYDERQLRFNQVSRNRFEQPFQTDG